MEELENNKTVPDFLREKVVWHRLVSSDLVGRETLQRK